MAQFERPENPDDAFVQRIEDIVGSHLADSEFDTGQAAAAAGISRMHLNRKLRALTGQSTHGFVRLIRLRYSLFLLRQPDHMVSDVARQIGFRSLSHFAKVFRAQFGVSPSEYQRMEGPEVARFGIMMLHKRPTPPEIPSLLHHRQHMLHHH